MSIPVKIEDLARALRDFDQHFLLTSRDGSVKVVGVEASVETDSVLIPTSSGGSARNLETNPTATLMCPPREAGGYTLLVDGTAVSEGDGFRLRPTRAVLHRRATPENATLAAADGAACVNDCVDL